MPPAGSVLTIPTSGAASGRAGEQQLLTQPLRADVLLVPHHGSKTSSSGIYRCRSAPPRLVSIERRLSAIRADVLQRYLDSSAASCVAHRGQSNWAASQTAWQTRLTRDHSARYWR